MDYTNATNDQLWTILRSDMDCPLPLMEGAFQEAIDRGMIKQFILFIIKKKQITPNSNTLIHLTYDDLIQIGYEAAVKAVKEFTPGKGTLTVLLYVSISNAIAELFRHADRKKRRGKEVSYHTVINDEKTIEYYLIDQKTNVEKTVLRKLQLEEKLQSLKPVQRDIFHRFYQGYTCSEIAEQMSAKVNTVNGRLRRALETMAGYKINIVELGLFERASYKKQGA